jgi:hypothetical protein
MSLGSETRASGELPDCVGETLFELPRGLEILDGSTADTDKVVVVVAGDPFGEFKPGVLIAAHHSAHDSGVLKKGEVLVRGALGQARFGGHELSGRHRPTCPCQGFDQDLAPGGEALARSSKVCRHQGLKVVNHRPSLPSRVSYLHRESFSL